ncbi:hypothetical protein V2J09_003967 [Rumex salicifolius]
MGFGGPRFTWSRGNHVASRISKRLDNFFTCTRQDSMARISKSHIWRPSTLMLGGGRAYVARVKWVMLGYRNTKYFHTTTLVRRKRNKTEMLKNSDEEWITDQSELEELARGFYMDLYTVDPRDYFHFHNALPRKNFPPLMTLIGLSFHSMSPLKAPGSDGFHATSELPGTINETVLVLIGKIANPEKMAHFRPINLYNVLLKIITKTLTGRLKEVTPQLVGPTQGSFVKGRIRAMKECLDRFYGASGQKVSLEKSKIVVSKNVNKHLVEALSHDSGISLTSDLGKYLEIPIYPKRINKNTFNTVIEQIQTKLNGWRCRMLNMAARVTLAKSALNTIPSYTMNTIVLPKGSCHRIDKMCRDFIWGSFEGRKEPIWLIGP